MSAAKGPVTSGPRPNTAAERVASASTTTTHVAASRGPATVPRRPTMICPSVQPVITAQIEVTTTKPLTTPDAKVTSPPMNARNTNAYAANTTKRSGAQAAFRAPMASATA